MEEKFIGNENTVLGEPAVRPAEDSVSAAASEERAAGESRPERETENKTKLRFKKIREKYFTTKCITTVAVMSALAGVFYAFLKFKLPFIFPDFLSFHLSDLPVALTGFLYGPVAGTLVVVLRMFLKLLFTGTATVGVGELGDLILGLAFLYASYFVYSVKRSKKYAVLGLLAGTLAATFTGMIVNRFLLVPSYVSAMGGWEKILGGVSGLYGEVTPETFYNYYLWLGVLPFNLLRCGVTSVITFFTYKRLSKLIKPNKNKSREKKEESTAVSS